MILGVVVIAQSGSEDEAGSSEPPGECVDRWNQDADARRFGAHNFSGHGYRQVQVTQLTELQDVPLEQAGEGVCAVIFAAASLDPERLAAGEVHRAGSWIPISRIPEVEVEQGTLADLQSDALSEANGRLEPDGTISAP